MAKAKIIGMPWGLASIWEESFRCLPDRPLQKRSHIYASELGGSFHDRYLKMGAVPYSNPYNFRSQEKMMAGKFHEAIVKLVLVATGILKREQVRSEIELPDCLRVTGKMDFMAGGQIDWDEAKFRADKVKELFAFCFDDLYPYFNHMTDKILCHFKNIQSNGFFMEMILEAKSVSGFVMQLIKKGNKPRRGHPLQSLHYLLGNKHIPKAIIPYISREDTMIEEFYIERTKPMLKEYKEDVATMTAYYNEGAHNFNKNVPPTDSEVLFEEAAFKFVKNNKVEYSPYLTRSYKYKNIDHFKEKWDKTLTQYNRAFRRHTLEGTPTGVQGNPLKLTDGNKIVIDEMRSLFPQYEKYVGLARKSGAFLKPELEEEEA